MPLALQASSLTDKGKVRDQNEDSVWAGSQSFSDQDPVALLIVCDGVGGAAGGELASKWALQTIRRALEDLFLPPQGAATIKLSEEEIEAQLSAGATRKLSDAEIAGLISTGASATRKLPDSAWLARLRDAVVEANEAVLDLAKKRPAEAGDAGTTAVVALVHGEEVALANVGDSRAYLLRDGKLTQISRDHSVVASLVAGGMLDPDDIYIHPQRNVIYRSLGGSEQMEVDLFPLTLQDGDRLLLCSDGLWEMVRNPKIVELLGKAKSPQEACKALVKAANDGGGEDNISVAVLFVG